MAEQEKTMAAALAAVATYMQQEEEEYRRQMAATLAQSQAPAGPQNLWGQSGRQSMMQLRTLMQIKAFHRLG